MSDEQHSELISEAAVAEGAYEAFVVRVVLENDLSDEQRAALWCLRSALKQLRYAIRQGKPLRWWRSDIHGTSEPGYREYQAYKDLVSIVARILTEPGQRNARLGKTDRAAALKEITGNGARFTVNERFAELLPKGQQEPKSPPPHKWVLLAEQLGQRGASVAEVSSKPLDSPGN